MKPTTLITGAGIRIGAAIAEHLAGQGHDLVLHFQHSKAEAEALAARRITHGAKVTLVHADLTDAAALAEFWQGLPLVTHVIHNASVYQRDRISDFTSADLRRHLAVNFEAPLLLTQGFLAQLPKEYSGNVIVLGDGTKGWSISPEFFTYAASKYIWESMIDLLAAACAPRVRANLIALAPTLKGDGEDPLMFERLASRSVLQRNGTLADLLTAIDFLLAGASVTGQTVSLAGGFALATKRPN